MKKLLLLSAVFLFSQSTFAVASQQPESCPTVENVKTVGLDYAEYMKQDEAWTVAKLKNDFKTTQEWTFAIFGVKADDQSTALTTGNELLPTLTFKEGPTELGDRWICWYNHGQELAAVAITPPVSPHNLSNLNVKFR